MPQLAYLNGQFIDPEQLTISVFDSGFVLGTTVSEQLRTFGGKLFQVDDHFDRMASSLEIIGVQTVDFDGLKAAAHTLVEKNYAVLQPGDDLGLSIFVTPGLTVSAGNLPQPTIGMFTRPLPFASWVEKYTAGQKLGVSSVRQIPGNCWPASLKCRSRMHYFLADQEIQQRLPDARAVLLDQDGFVAEASTANILLFQQQYGVVSPMPNKVLGGISVSVVKQLASEAGLAWTHRDISVDELLAADEVFLCSTSPCLLPVTEIDGQHIGAGRPGEIFHKLISLWSQRVDTDIVRQAQQADLQR